MNVTELIKQHTRKNLMIFLEFTLIGFLYNVLVVPKCWVAAVIQTKGETTHNHW